MDTRATSVSEVVRRVGLLTESAVDLLTSHGSVCESSDDMRSLVSKGELFRHRPAKGECDGVYYTASRFPLKVADFRSALAVCRYLFHRPAPRAIVAERVLRQSLQSVAGAWSAWGEDLPPCFIDRPTPSAQGTLAVVRTGLNKTLQSAVSELDRFAASERCVPLWHYADCGGLCIHYLFDATADECEELEQWLRHRPPLATCGRPAHDIAVRVIAVESLS